MARISYKCVNNATNFTIPFRFITRLHYFYFCRQGKTLELASRLAPVTHPSTVNQGWLVFSKLDEPQPFITWSSMIVLLVGNQRSTDREFDARMYHN